MRIGDYGLEALKEFPDVEIEDLSSFRGMVFRIVEDTIIVPITLAKSQRKDTIDESLMREALGLITTDVARTQEAPPDGIVRSRTVGDLMRVDFRRASVGYKEEVITVLARFVNFQLIEMLRTAASQAVEENLQSVKLRHILPACEKWPWPLNRWC